MNLCVGDQHLGVVADVEARGYICVWIILSPTICGVPQDRRRWYMVGWREDSSSE